MTSGEEGRVRRTSEDTLHPDQEEDFLHHNNVLDPDQDRPSPHRTNPKEEGNVTTATLTLTRQEASGSPGQRSYSSNGPHRV